MSIPAPPPDLRATGAAGAGAVGRGGAAGRATGGGWGKGGGGAAGFGGATRVTTPAWVGGEAIVGGTWRVGSGVDRMVGGTVGVSLCRRVGVVPGRVKDRRSAAISWPLWYRASGVLLSAFLMMLHHRVGHVLGQLADVAAAPR